MHKKAAAIVLSATALALLPPFSGAVGGFIRVFTEGNSPAKHVVFLLLLLAFFAAKTLLPARVLAWFRGKQKYFRPLFFLAVVLGFFAGIAVQLYVQNSLGGGFGSYFSLVTDCGQASCWEATYFQHVHAMKSAVYFVEKTTGVFLPANADDGKPVYEMLSAIGIADYVAVASLVLLAAILLLTYAAALAEKEGWKSALVALAGVVSLLAVLDGGLFSLAGTTALTLLLVVAADGLSLGKAEAAKPFAVSGISLFFSWAPYWFLGTGLYFREWLTAPLFICSAYFFAKQKNKKNWLLAASIALLAVSTTLVLSDAVRHWQGEQSPAVKMLAYGIPLDATDAQVADAAASRLVARYGWYALLWQEKPFNAAQEAEKLRKALKPRGYLLAEAAGIAPKQTDAYIIWLSPPIALDDTASFSGASALQLGQIMLLEGTAALNGPQLALELGSYIHANGGKAIVVTQVI